MKIEVYTRSMNHQLYRLSQSTILLPYNRKRLLFTSADGFFYDNIMNSKADIIINIDEDAFITDNKILKNLLEYVIDNDYINCGVPDGGVIPIRKHNPLVTNPFFNIFNVSKIKEKFNLNDILENYSTHKVEFEKFAPNHLLKHIYEYDYYEPYYSFFVWLGVNFKTLYLDANEHSDGISTVVKDHLGQHFLYHSWYSRLYGKDKFHTLRINKLVNEALGNDMTNELIKGQNFFCKLYEDFGQKYYYPIKYRLERKKGY